MTRIPLPKLVPKLAWDPEFAGRHPAHRVLDRAARCFAHAPEWPAPATWRDSLAAEGLATALVSAGGLPIVFAASPPKSSSRRRRGPVDLGTLYEERIFARGEVPSRPNGWHDFLNMLVWATFPAAKRELNARQRAALVATVRPGAVCLPGARTREQDALTMLDEGGLVVLVDRCTASAAHEALDRSDADALAGLVRGGGAVVLTFGHTLHEHLLSGAGTVRALALPLEIDGLMPTIEENVRLADRLLAVALAEHRVLTTPDGVASLPLNPALFG